jgi:hypothetical protein
MNSMKTGAVSGCVVWIVLSAVLSGCILPCFFIIGSVTSFSEYAIQTTGKALCPKDTTPESYSYETTRTDEYGNTQPTTAYQLHCLDSNGEVVKTDPIVYAFLWDGIFILVGLLLVVGLSFALAAPAGAVIAKFLNRTKTG